ncbi:MAG: hypothetical protein FWC94_04920 [Bacteroidales bacterium]|nr:hypothetical protein [Bacteroidales bacterium]
MYKKTKISECYHSVRNDSLGKKEVTMSISHAVGMRPNGDTQRLHTYGMQGIEAHIFLPSDASLQDAKME